MIILSCEPLGAGSSFDYLLHTPNGRNKNGGYG